ncbi:hypothetical protein [Bifidobacterium callimiconis]|uniref:tRNA nuclease CdiA C-terminal domain-containing protein n=1 Tax=Bifidobacterium callimiconis TaxID=2306973 RepID=A0A430FIH1_9BIFI|nr:hypothetical protein [Bifidobacterium callimiconis]RSX52659.1 hypothetical protein D2E23_0387 [Bifidobacterium callimiconis]
MELNDLQVPNRREELERQLDAAYDRYKRELAKLQRNGAADIGSIWDDDFTFPDAESRIEEARATLERYSDRASQLASDYYDSIRELWGQYSGVELPEFDRGDMLDPNRVVWQLAGGFNQTDYPGLHYQDVIPGTDGKVHNKYGKSIEELWPKTDDMAGYQSYIARLVMSAGRLTLMDTIGRDPTQPRWARVPNGPTCEFCVMLASRGWVYWTEDSARLGGSFHNGNCDCSVVPSWGAQKLKGYDPDRLYEQYQQCADTTARLVTRDEYRKYEKAYVPKNDEDRPLEYKVWKRNRILAEMRTRDRQWLYDGRPASVSYASTKAKAELKAHEKLTRDALAANGFTMWFPERSDEEGVTTADCVINGKTVDFKAPKGNGKNTIDQLLRHAAKQGKAAVIHLQEGRGTMTSELCVESIRKSLARRKLEYVLFIDYDGSITRFVQE